VASIIEQIPAKRQNECGNCLRPDMPMNKTLLSIQVSFVLALSLSACTNAPLLTPTATRVLEHLNTPLPASTTAPPPTPTATRVLEHLNTPLPASTTAPPPTLVSYVVGERPRAIAIADLNKDGLPDVVVTSLADESLTLLFGIAGGQFQPATATIPTGKEPSDVDAIDLNHDGNVDLVIANHETPQVTVLLNDGSANFTPAPGSPFDTGARPHVHGLATGDFNGDGWNDVAVESADTQQIRVLLGGSNGLDKAISIGVGTMPYFRLGAADVTGDGYPDVLVPGHSDNTVRVVRVENGGLATAPWKLEISDRPWMVVGDDVTGDGRTDIIVVHTEAVSVWLAGAGGFSQAPGSPFGIPGATEVATGDLDGDGISDIAVGPWNGDDVILVAGKTWTRSTVSMCERPIGLAIADLDGDLRGELLAACATTDRLVVRSGSQ
jgi:hypothetical protein